MTSLAGGSCPSPMEGIISVPRSNGQNMDHVERQRHGKQDIKQIGQDFRPIADQDIIGKFFDVEEDGPPLLHSGNDTGEIIIEQNDLGRLARDIGSLESPWRCPHQPP